MKEFLIVPKDIKIWNAKDKNVIVSVDELSSYNESVEMDVVNKKGNKGRYKMSPPFITKTPEKASNEGKLAIYSPDMHFSMLCDICGNRVGIGNFKKIDGIEKIKSCRSCDIESYAETIKSKYFICEYDKFQIYKKDDSYFPFWDERLYFDSLSDCKQWIDRRIEMYNRAKELICTSKIWNK